MAQIKVMKTFYLSERYVRQMTPSFQIYVNVRQSLHWPWNYMGEWRCNSSHSQPRNETAAHSASLTPAISCYWNVISFWLVGSQSGESLIKFLPPLMMFYQLIASHKAGLCVFGCYTQRKGRIVRDGDLFWMTQHCFSYGLRKNKLWKDSVNAESASKRRITVARDTEKEVF